MRSSRLSAWLLLFAFLFGGGAWALLEVETILARGVRPRRSASLSRIITIAAAPSDIELELAAVTVPPSRNAGRKVGILERSAENGCSS